MRFPGYFGIGMFASALFTGLIVYFGTEPHTVNWGSVGCLVVGLALIVVGRVRAVRPR